MSTENSGDLKIEWVIDLAEGSLAFDTDDNDLKMDDGLVTSVLISLFSDQRAADDEVLPDPNSTDKRGWWGDLVIPEFEGDEIGSKLWLLERASLTQETLNLAIQYAEDSLDWMIQDGIASTITVTAERQGGVIDEILAMQISIQKSDGTELALNLSNLWEATIDAL